MYQLEMTHSLNGERASLKKAVFSFNYEYMFYILFMSHALCLGASSRELTD